MLVVSRRMFKYISLFSLFVKIEPSFSFILLPSVSCLNFAWNMFWFYKHWIILYFRLINCHELVWKVLHETELKKYEWTTSFYLILVRRFYQTYKIGHTSTLTFIHELRVWIGSPFSSTQNFYQAHQLLSILIFYRFPRLKRFIYSLNSYISSYMLVSKNFIYILYKCFQNSHTCTFQILPIKHIDLIYN